MGEHHPSHGQRQCRDGDTNSQNYSPSLLTSNGKVLSIKNAQGNTVLNWTANASGSETQKFNNAIGSLGLSPQGTAQLNISGLLLNAGQSYTLAQSGVSIYGNVGTESGTLASGVHNESIDTNVEKVRLPSPVSAYTWATQSGNISLFDAPMHCWPSLQLTAWPLRALPCRSQTKR